MEEVLERLRKCDLCPRGCLVDRIAGRTGFCGAGFLPKVARISLHHWEEPPVSGRRGSGAVFFSGCNLKCCFCQNYKISHGDSPGKEISFEELALKFISLEKQGAHNVNLVTGTPYVPQIVYSIKIARSMGFTIPVIYNTSAYEKVETIKMLKDYANVYLPDLKFASQKAGQEFADAPDYFETAKAAIMEMAVQGGPAVLDSEGIIRSGIIVRHLIMPGGTKDSIKSLEWIKANLPSGILVSLMAQYIPVFKAASHPGINRRITREEYELVVEKALELGLENGFMQELDAAAEEYIPEFDLTGV